MHRTHCIPVVVLFLSLLAFPVSAEEAPAGFTSLFDGTSLSGWRGRSHFDPRQESALNDDERKAQQDKWNSDRDQHWSVENGEVVSDGHGVFLTTEKDYGDFELVLDWKMIQPGGDSGIYLRGCPQVQIWDPANPREKKNGADRGSGALWNNNADNPGKWPLVKADRPIGEWNTFRIRMIGSLVWIWFNDQLTVDGQVLDNYFDRQSPVFATGCIQLQTHGSEMRFRNIFIREIGPDEANQSLRGGFASIFNGRDFTGWKGPTDRNQVQDGQIMAQHGTIYTEKEYEDFIVQFEFKLPPGGNNGLAIRYPGSGDTAYVGMCELQVLDNEHPKYASLDPRQYHGSAYGMVAAKRGYLREVGQWNFQRVSVEGSKIKVELNGVVILDTDISKVTEFMGGSDHPGKDRTKGHFGFAGHGDPVIYRHIELKEL